MEMSEFLRQEQRLLDLMFESDSEENLNEVCCCGRGKADMRCQECFNFNLRCHKCICEAHVHQPFHWVQRIQNGYFIPVDLECIGLVVFLGHGGHRCNNIASGRPSSAFTVVHHNGIHTARIAWCDCPNCGDHADQLMRAGCSLPHSRLPKQSLRSRCSSRPTYIFCSRRRARMTTSGRSGALRIMSSLRTHR